MGEELRNERSTNFSLMETGGREKAQMIRETISAGGLIFMSVRRYFGLVIWRRLCLIVMISY